VLSGVNRGQNLADDVTYSGTVAGAIQGALLGIPSVAMSLVCGPVDAAQDGRQPPIWETPMQHGAQLLRKLLDAGWPDGVVINVNYPNCEPSAVKGAAATVQGLRDPGLLRIEDRLDTRGRAYYWVGIERRRAEPPQGSDLWAVRSNLISVTPLCLDYTDQKSRERLAAALDGQGG
jgi:5'-nucleotidase